MAEESLISQQKLKEFGADYIKILALLLLQSGKNASGSLIRSLNYKIVGEAEQINIEILSNNYLQWVDKGRRRGTYPPIKPLINWTTIKGLPIGAAYGTQKNIFKFGIKPTNVIQRTIRAIETSNEEQKKYEDEVVNNIIKNINLKYKNK